MSPRIYAAFLNPEHVLAVALHQSCHIDALCPFCLILLLMITVTNLITCDELALTLLVLN
jgi:hypothetical protein